ncbi:MAG TPA: AraC family transcriptional regulator [Dokdonella sp.]
MTADQIPINALRIARFQALGLDMPRVLELAGLTEAMFEPPQARLNTRQFFAFWRAVEQVGANPAFGLELGGNISPQHYDVAAIAALHSANFGEALRKFARYKRLTCPEEITIEIAGGEAGMHARWLLAESDTPALLTDAMFAASLGLARHGTGRTIVPRRIEFARRDPGTSLHRDFFGCEVRFDAPRDLLVFDAATLDEPFLSYNEDLLAIMLPGLEAALRERGAPRTLTDQVDAILARGMRGQRPSIEAVAGELHISARTLQRRLAEAGTSYQQQLDRVRRQAARQLLTTTHLETGEIAFFLGFEELNSFTRAFHQWEGTTPNRWRESARH